MRATLVLLMTMALAAPAAALQTGQRTKTDPCAPRPDPEYDRRIAEYTTDRHFITELVDHLPASPCVPSPREALKYVIGAPGVLSRVADINAYMRLMASKSPRVKVFDIGRSEEGREMLVVAVSDADNIAQIDRYRGITAKLADPRNLTQEEAKRLIAEGKPFYWASGSIHSSETGSPEMLMELVYRLAVEESPFVQNIRRNSIVLITPVVETDGRDRMVDVYNYRQAHKGEMPLPLVWWGHYVAHDNNRDAMQLALAIDRSMMQAFFRFHPQVLHDLHESVPYLYISTGTGPYNAWLDPIVIGEWQSMAYYEVAEMTKRGVIGVWTHGFYDGWAPNYMFYVANGHNSIGRFYETFGNGGPDTRVRTLRPEQTSREWYRPNPPLPKVTWSMRNNVNLQQSALLLGISNVASHGAQFLENFWLKSKRSVEKARTEGPAAWVFPAGETRPLEQARLLNLLQAQGVEVHKMAGEVRVKRPKAPVQEAPPAAPGGGSAEPAAGELPVPAGSYVVRMDQPYSRMADMMLDTQYYSARDPRSYDDTGWTIGALRNVKTMRITDGSILDARMDRVDGEVKVGGKLTGSGKVYLINHNTENVLVSVRYAAPEARIDVAEASFEAEGEKFNAGTFITADEKVAQEALKRGLPVVGAASAPSVKTHALAAPRIALLFTWQNTQADGWYRIALDNLEVPYTYLPDTELRAMKPGELRARFDVVVLPPTYNSLSGLLRGIPMREGAPPLPWRNSPETPNLVAPGIPQADDIRGGAGFSGLANLEEFVTSGGLVLAMQSAAAIPAAAGMTEMVTVGESAALNAPGSVLLATVEDRKSPIAYGYGDQLHVYFRRGPIIRVSAGAPEAVREPGRSSGRGSAADPDVIQARPYLEPEPEPRRSPAERELYIPEDNADQIRAALPPASRFPRVILRFARERELLHSGMIVGAAEIAERPAVVDVPRGKGHIVLFANNPMWRDLTMGSYFLMFNAMLNYDHLDAGR